MEDPTFVEGLEYLGGGKFIISSGWNGESQTSYLQIEGDKIDTV